MTVVDLSPAAAGSTEYTPGWLGQAPASWLHQLVLSLPAEDRLSLFQSCSLLAKQVVHNVPCIQLKLLAKPPEDHANDHDRHHTELKKRTEQRRNILKQLLHGCKQLKLRLRPGLHQPFPTECSPYVVHITIEPCPRATSATECLQWGDMTSLEGVKWLGPDISPDDVRALCAAMKAGQVPNLTSFEAPACCKIPEVQLVAETLGPQLQRVSTTCKELLQQVDAFTALQSLRMADSYLNEEVARSVCEHPTLRNVTFLGDCGIIGDHSQRRCTWQKLVLSDANPDILGQLPLASLREIRFISSIFACSEADRAALTHVFIHHRKKVEYEPGVSKDGVPSFTLYCPCENLVQPLQQMTGVGKFYLQGGVLTPAAIPALWQSLPTCLQTVCWVGMYGAVDWPRIWNGLPQHITQFELVKCDMAAQDACAWVAAAPLHITTIVMQHYNEFIQQWVAAGLQAAVPAHATLRLAVERRD